jgi:hypothetical protein
MAPLPCPVPGGRGMVKALNDRGDVLMHVFIQQAIHCFLITDKGVIELLEYPEAARTIYHDINSSRQLIGTAYKSIDSNQGMTGFIATIPDKTPSLE